MRTRTRTRPSNWDVKAGGGASLLAGVGGYPYFYYGGKNYPLASADAVLYGAMTAGASQPYALSPLSYSDRGERITDVDPGGYPDLGQWIVVDNKKKRVKVAVRREDVQWHPVEHTRVQHYNPPFWEKRIQYNYITKLPDQLQLSAKVRLAPPAVSLSELVAPTPLQLHDWRARAYDDLVPSFESDLAGALFLWELPDIRRLYTLGVSIIEKHAAFFSTMKNTLRKRKAARDLLNRKPAELLLAHDFGVAPLIDDLEKLIRGIFDLRPLLDDFNRRGRTRKVYRTRYHNVSDTYVDSGTRRTRAIKLSQFTAQAELTYQYGGDKSALDLFMDYYKLGLTPELLWQKMPFSFLIDWVVKIGDSLESVSKTHATPNVSRYSEAVKTQLWKVIESNPSSAFRQETFSGGTGPIHIPLSEKEEILIPNAYCWSHAVSYVRTPQDWFGKTNYLTGHIRLPRVTFKSDYWPKRAAQALALVRTVLIR